LGVDDVVVRWWRDEHVMDDGRCHACVRGESRGRAPCLACCGRRSHLRRYLAADAIGYVCYGSYRRGGITDNEYIAGKALALFLECRKTVLQVSRIWRVPAMGETHSCSSTNLLAIPRLLSFERLSSTDHRCNFVPRAFTTRGGV